jgi:hypothetical protein
VHHRPSALQGRSLKDVLATRERRPEALAELFSRGRHTKFRTLRQVSPTIALAAIAQARAEGSVSPEEESRLLAGLLTDWALRKSLSASCV